MLNFNLCAIILAHEYVKNMLDGFFEKSLDLTSC